MFKKEELKRIAYLAGLELSDEELNEFIPEFEEIISHVDMIGELDTGGIDPFEREETDEAHTKDKAEEPLEICKALENAPNKKDNFIIISKEKYE